MSKEESQEKNSVFQITRQNKMDDVKNIISLDAQKKENNGRMEESGEASLGRRFLR